VSIAGSLQTKIQRRDATAPLPVPFGNRVSRANIHRGGLTQDE
jgi:hypothetical protein